MITIGLQGGLGNQLFQIFATIAYSLERKIPFKFPLNRGHWAHISRAGKKYRRNAYWDNFFLSLKRFTMENFPRLYRWREDNFCVYNPIPLFKSDTVLLGYFQSYKYFEKQYENVIKFLRLRKQQHDVKEKYSQYFKNIASIASIHFRYGDYKLDPDIYKLQPIEYYVNALNIISNEITHVLCFGEEHDAEKLYNNIKILKKKFPNISFELIDFKISDWEQMLLMSCCEHNIIANSTFSWWGAYFNANENKIICYPKEWFTLGSPKTINMGTKDLCPKNWISV